LHTEEEFNLFWEQRKSELDSWRKTHNIKTEIREEKISPVIVAGFFTSKELIENMIQGLACAVMLNKKPRRRKWIKDDPEPLPYYAEFALEPDDDCVERKHARVIQEDLSP